MSKLEITAYLCLAGGMLVWLLILVNDRMTPVDLLLPIFGAVGAACAAADRRIWLSIVNGLVMISPLLLLLAKELLR
ncbi:hypothetical protein [Jeotgalibacillus salarius]|uniref:Uncharacterized protein n=1 Tax=Jeotgalibacillus salarius TaxID=546023 RepID=A0A4Y8LEK3_9BACL|nr:hypothetical protein [Jeotgalibacillus salarius]TFE00483.1 hypothetical protein E2626_10910 [Jeotgalibacillus salarius]